MVAELGKDIRAQPPDPGVHIIGMIPSPARMHSLCLLMLTDHVYGVWCMCLRLSSSFRGSVSCHSTLLLSFLGGSSSWRSLKPLIFSSETGTINELDEYSLNRTALCHSRCACLPTLASLVILCPLGGWWTSKNTTLVLKVHTRVLNALRNSWESWTNFSFQISNFHFKDIDMPFIYLYFLCEAFIIILFPAGKTPEGIPQRRVHWTNALLLFFFFWYVTNKSLFYIHTSVQNWFM